MKIPFRYQTTEYDCVPTTFINALQYLFNRDEIPPEVIQKIMIYSLDNGKKGTTGEAVKQIMQYLKSFSNDKFAFKRCEYLPKEQIHLKQGNKIMSCINNGGIALLRVCDGKTSSVFHYMLALGIDNRDSDWLLFFDPYYRVQKFTGENSKYIEWLGDNHRQNANLRINRKRLDSQEYEKYSMASVDERECCLLERK